MDKNDFTLDEILNWFKTVGSEPSIVYDKSVGFYRCDALVDGKTISGMATNPKDAALHTWAKCTKKVSYTFLMMQYDSCASKEVPIKTASAIQNINRLSFLSRGYTKLAYAIGNFVVIKARVFKARTKRLIKRFKK